ncbi:hypothetical protein VTL71DRAFT_3567 [Oculimacula yallundae]|uniref:F-box domain-containing protein n=1 Tax=Oculimacula yallundae TaxID=86028 RepID=A0ABR4C8Q2_9HELO
MTTLPVDILYTIGEAINSRCTLAALCRVSKAFNGLYSPILYAHIHVQDCDPKPLLEGISALPTDSHLRFTKKLHIGRNALRFPHRESGTAIDSCLIKMPELISLEITNSVEELALSSENSDALDIVVQRGKLRHLTIVASDQTEFPLLKARFTNLHTLSLHHIPRNDPDGRHGLVHILLASPHLKHLGLSNRDFKGTELYKLAQEYSSERFALKLELLKLETLDLGVGYQPTDMTSKVLKEDSDYLSQLTDLEYLTSLQLRNCTVRGYERHTNQDVHVPLFHAAVNLKSIEVETLSKDIDKLLQYLCRVNPGGLKSLAFVGINYPFEDGIDSFSHDIRSLISPAPILGHSWWTLSFTESSTQEGNHYMKDFIMNCPDLHYLACPMNTANLKLFKTYMPKLMHLHTLIITKGDFPDHVPTTVNVAAQLDARDKERETEEGVWQPFSAHPEITRVGEDGREQAKNRARDRGEKIRKGIAEDLFKLSREIFLNRPGTCKGEPLKYVGLGYRVYRWVLPGPGETYGERRVEQLSFDEAMTFKEVWRALMVSPDAP